MGINYCNVTLFIYRSLSFQNIICNNFIPNGRAVRHSQESRPASSRKDEASGDPPEDGHPPPRNAGMQPAKVVHDNLEETQPVHQDGLTPKSEGRECLEEGYLSEKSPRP